ncbi:PIG-L family deacetylase [Nostoc sp. FACHB-152]|uniref:PIG-L deacetylase family protein n=1 Tax=unclassified Nostoc TaxID=2593658 RepID=UPI0016885F9E|nr:MULTISPECIES: PIG-L deacetylase family protein [unclassified Nostoc]MBD2450641.1 PIG-L family deacetylase [Nostoc sp. FACHB-152]MBD2470109.1 PIG-L family deacetylase [Nostoc sp. FACHB-145]
MNIKGYLQQIQKLVPRFWLEQMQYIQSNLIVHWILFRGSKPLSLNQKSAMVFSPHQDDETFGCGGMIAQKREQGVSVVVVFLTDGQGGGNSDVESKNKIVQIRKQESIKALTILGVEASKIYFLDKQDGSLLNLKTEARLYTISQIAELLNKYKPEEVYVPHKKDCHRDHEASYELVKAAISESARELELIQYPIWLFWRAPLFIMLKLQDIAAAYSLSITSVQHKKNQAIAAYTSQLNGLPRGFVKRFFGAYEIFFKADS